MQVGITVFEYGVRAAQEISLFGLSWKISKTDIKPLLLKSWEKKTVGEIITGTLNMFLLQHTKLRLVWFQTNVKVAIALFLATILWWNCSRFSFLVYTLYNSMQVLYMNGNASNYAFTNSCILKCVNAQITCILYTVSIIKLPFCKLQCQFIIYYYNVLF